MISFKMKQLYLRASFDVTVNLKANENNDIHKLLL